MSITDETNPSRCYDWMMVCGTNHYARDRAAFTTYKPVPHGPVQVGCLNVVGVGTVELQVPRSRNDPRINTLVVENVLHDPNAMCNGISLTNLPFAWELPSYQMYDLVAGELVGYGRLCCGLPRLVLAGEPRGVSNMVEGALYSLSIYASPVELEVLARRLNYGF